MCPLKRIQQWLCERNLHGVLIPSTDEYLSEFAQPAGRRLKWVTGFSGSTGLAIVLQDRAALFLDGRYQALGERETPEAGIEVLDAAVATRERWLAAHLRAGQRLAVDGRLHAYTEGQRLREFAKEHGLELMEPPQNPVDALWGAERPAAFSSRVFDYPTRVAGWTTAEKFTRLREWLTERRMDCYLLADPEDVAWLLNVRTDDARRSVATSWHSVPAPLSRVWVEATGRTLWFIERSHLEPALAERLQNEIEIVDPSLFEATLEERSAKKVVGVNLRRTPQRFADIVAAEGVLVHDAAVSRWRWAKHPNEVKAAREAHRLDGQAVIRFMAWLQKAVSEHTVTEIDAARTLERFRGEFAEYMGLSMPMLSASGPNGAIPHYVPSEHTNRILNDHPIYWIDSGGQYYGCSTDNTVCMALGTPEKRHIRAHTLVVKGFIALTVTRFPVDTLSNQLDTLARQYLWQEGMDYGHGTGHGVGNFMNVHEGPLISKVSDHPWIAPMTAGMVVSNEPGYYQAGDFGIRIESHMVTVPSKHAGFLEFETLSKLPIDPRLIDESLLTTTQKRWLADYHVGIRDAYEGCFDQETAEWLRSIVNAYVTLAR